MKEPKSVTEVMSNPDVIAAQVKCTEDIGKGVGMFESFAKLSRAINEATYPELRIKRQENEN